MCSWVEIPSPAHLADKPRSYKPIDINIVPSTVLAELEVYTVVSNTLSSDRMCRWVEIPSLVHLTDKPRNYKPLDINMAPSTVQAELEVYTVVGNTLS